MVAFLVVYYTGRKHGQLSVRLVVGFFGGEPSPEERGELSPEERIGLIEREVERLKEYCLTVGDCFAHMDARLNNLTAFLLGKGILNEADLDDIKNTEEEVARLEEDANRTILLDQADEGKPQ